MMLQPRWEPYPLMQHYPFLLAHYLVWPGIYLKIRLMIGGTCLHPFANAESHAILGTFLITQGYQLQDHSHRQLWCNPPPHSVPIGHQSPFFSFPSNESKPLFISLSISRSHLLILPLHPLHPLLLMSFKCLIF